MMDDLINRQDAIDAIEKYLDKFDCIDANFLDGLKTTKKILNDLPSAESEQQWIPCSERLPEEDGEYLVESTRGYEVLYYREEEKQFGLMVFNFAGKVGFVPKKVYEWMPIPGVEE